jgi:hypothetical protein
VISTSRTRSRDWKRSPRTTRGLVCRTETFAPDGRGTAASAAGSAVAKAIARIAILVMVRCYRSSSGTMRAVRKLLGAAFVALACTSSVGAATGQGLYGSVTRGPTRPVCSAEESCSEPAAHTKLRFLRRTVLVATAVTDARGRYRVRLPRGVYTVRVAGAGTSGVGGRIDPASVRVRAVWRQQNFDIDTGIR